MGILLKGTENPIIVMAPENSADAPAPATARPTMSIGELVAVAQIIEPTAESEKRIGREDWD